MSAVYRERSSLLQSFAILAFVIYEMVCIKRVSARSYSIIVLQLQIFSYILPVDYSRSRLT